MGGGIFKTVQHSSCDMGFNPIILRHGNQNQNKNIKNLQIIQKRHMYKFGVKESIVIKD